MSNRDESDHELSSDSEIENSSENAYNSEKPRKRQRSARTTTIQFEKIASYMQSPDDFS